MEVGRISEKDAIWISKLMDLEMLSFEGTSIDVPKNFKSGVSPPAPSLLHR